MSVRNIEVSRLLGLSAIPVIHGPEDAAQVWIKGAPLINTVQEITIAGTEPVDAIIGIALSAASGVTGEDRIIACPLPGVVFKGNIGTSITAGDIAATDQFAIYPLQLSGTDWFVDKTDNTNPCVRIIAFIDAVGTTNGLVEFIFLQDTTVWAN